MNAPIDHAALAESMSLEDINVSDPRLFQQDVWMHYFRRLRRDAPVHYCKESAIGPYWSVTKYKDIVATEVNSKVFSSSSALGGITLRDQPADRELPMFIAMDQPKHDEQRKIVQPIVSPANLASFEGLIRSRIQKTIDDLPRGETFYWVDKVSIELTGQMLATLFDFPFHDRRKLTYWSDVATTDLNNPERLVNSDDEREAIFQECLGYFMKLWNERVNAREPGGDLISMLAHGEATRNMGAREYLGNVILLIVGLIAAGFVLTNVRASAETPAAKPAIGKATLWAAVGGFTSFIANAGGPPVQVYLMPQKLPPPVFAGTMTMLFAIVNWIKFFAFFGLGQLSAANLSTSAVLVPVAVASTFLGVWMVRRLSGAKFYPIVKALTFAVGVKLIWDGLQGLLKVA